MLFAIIGTSTSWRMHDGLPSSFKVPQPVATAFVPTYLFAGRVNENEIERKKKRRKKKPLRQDRQTNKHPTNDNNQMPKNCTHTHTHTSTHRKFTRIAHTFGGG